MKKAEMTWNQIAAVIIILVVIIVSILVYTGKVGQSTKDITKCGGLLTFGKNKGECMAAPCPSGTIESSTFSSDCAEGQKCCLIETAGEV